MAKGAKLEASLIYPREVKIRDGRNVSLRLMEPGDRQRILNFASSLPPDDLLFLRTDITDPTTIDQWLQSIEAGTTITVLAEFDSEVAGYASLHTDGARWTRLVGEVRVQVRVDYRGAGLGKRLVGEVFRLGQDLGLKKMATLQDWVVDRAGGSRDLVIMSLVCER
jgi:GNAT superfamily N-acetyltransferase